MLLYPFNHAAHSTSQDKSDLAFEPFSMGNGSDCSIHSYSNIWEYDDTQETVNFAIVEE